MLLAGLQRHAQRILAAYIFRDAVDSAWNVAFIRFFGGEISRMWSAEPHRDAKALRAAHHHIGAPFAGGSKQYQAEQVGDSTYVDVATVQLFLQASIVGY